MDTLQIQNLYNTVNNEAKFYSSYGSAFGNYSQVCELFDKLIILLENNLSYSKGLLSDHSDMIYKKLKNQNLDERLNFIKLCKLHEDDVENLKKTLLNYTGNNVPTLDLFPGIGQFLPHVLASEPLFVADRFIEICNFAADYLQNDFYKIRRLRKYEIKNFELSNLPYKSFGLVYCFNEFYYGNIDYIKKWASAIYELLYNGGIFIFNFMPDDQLWSQEAAIKLEYTVVNYNDLIDIINQIGFIVIDSKIQPFRSSYIVCKKLGEVKERYKVGGSWAEIIDL